MYEPDRRRHDYCDIWGLVATQDVCPACSGEVAARWEEERSGPAEPAVSEERETPSFLDLPERTGDVRAEASELLGLLAS